MARALRLGSRKEVPKSNPLFKKAEGINTTGPITRLSLFSSNGRGDETLILNGVDALLSAPELRCQTIDRHTHCGATEHSRLTAAHS